MWPEFTAETCTFKFNTYIKCCENGKLISCYGEKKGAQKRKLHYRSNYFAHLRREEVGVIKDDRVTAVRWVTSLCNMRTVVLKW